MRAVDADKLPVQKIYHVDEAGFGATYYMVDVEDIKAAPTITYADLVPHGWWVVDECDGGEPDGYPAFIEFHCPHCNEPYSLESGEYDWFYGDDIPFNFCHNCGAKMDVK